MGAWPYIRAKRWNAGVHTRKRRQGVQRRQWLDDVTDYWTGLKLPEAVTLATERGWRYRCRRCRHGKAPQYLVDCCTPVTDVVGRQRLRSATVTATDGGVTTSAIHCWTPSIRCARPHGLDDLRAQQDYESFRQGLKT